MQLQISLSIFIANSLNIRTLKKKGNDIPLRNYE